MFDNAKLKIKRANQHITELNGIFARFVHTDFCSVEIEQDSKGTWFVGIRATKQLPNHVPNVIGDALHNMRTALDYTYVGIVRSCGGGATKYAKFPFGYSRKGLVGTENGRKIEAASAAVLDLIIGVTDPDLRGDHPFYALHDTDIEDKHIDTVPLIVVVELIGARVEDIKRNNKLTLNVQVSPGGEIKTIMEMKGDYQITNKGQPAFEVFFGKGQVFEGEPVIPALHQLSQLVAGYIEALEKAFLATA